MTADDFRKLYHAEPFEAFQVELKDGRRFLVAKRENLSISPRNNRIVVGTTMDDFEFIELNEIAGVRHFGPLVTTSTASITSGP